MTPDRTQDDGVLTPEELQLEDDRVDELGDNRYLVRPDDSNAANALAASEDPTITTPTDSSHLTQLESGASGGEREASDRLADAAAPHGVDIALKTDGEVAEYRATSHDVREVFVDLLTWYADQLDDDLSPEEALQVMLTASDLDV